MHSRWFERLLETNEYVLGDKDESIQGLGDVFDFVEFCQSLCVFLEFVQPWIKSLALDLSNPFQQ